MIKATELSLDYGDFTAVEGVSFDIPAGEIVGLLGHNGAGKTTILKMLTGFLEPSAGRIEIAGMSLAEHREEVQKKIGYLPENCPLYPEMTVISALEYAAELQGVPEGERLEAVREAIAQTELSEKASQPIHTLSRGYRQRVGVAQAILHRPEVLILDEPTNGLDPSQIQHMRSLITGLGKCSTVILSTHILQEVQAVCDRVIIILNGRLALDSRLADLQRSERLLLCIDRGPEESRARLSGLGGVQSVEFLTSEGVQHHYALELEHTPSGNGLAELTPGIVRALMQQGTDVFAIHPETRDLEIVFREINTDAAVAAHEV
jgi:ABC-2 type transport system ATP-binding protein